MALPDGFAVHLAKRTMVADGGSTLVGGVPTRVFYLAAAALDMFDSGRLVVRSSGSASLAARLLDAGVVDPVVADLADLADWEHSVTIVVPVHDRVAGVRRLLTSIDQRVHVVLVDDHSVRPEPVRRIAAEFCATLIELPRNLGPAGARNAGLAVVTTPYVVFLDSDMIIDPETIPVLLRHFADPRVGLVAPRIAGLEPQGTPNWITRYEQARSSLDLGSEPANVRPGARVSWLPAACLVARTDAMGLGFSPDMRVAEDVDLVWRLVESGWGVRYEPAVEARHEHRRTLVDWLSRKAFYGTGADDLAARHGATVAPAVYTPWTLALVGALLAQRRWSLPVAFGAAIVAAVRIRSRLRPTPDRERIALQLTGMGALAAIAQTAELLVRHWWPVAALASLVSRRVRRAVLIAALADAVYEHRRTDTGLDLARFALARRLDDLAYGAGVWWGAARSRSTRALRPVMHLASRLR